MTVPYAPSLSVSFTNTSTNSNYITFTVTNSSNMPVDIQIDAYDLQNPTNNYWTSVITWTYVTNWGTINLYLDWDNNSVINDQYYTSFRVRCRDSYSIYDISSWTTTGTYYRYPSPPYSISSSNITSSTARINFTRGANADYTIVAINGNNVWSGYLADYVDITGLSANTTYTYTVRSYNNTTGYQSAVVSGYSLKTTANPLQASSCTISRLDSTGFQVSATGTGSYYANYDIYESPVGQWYGLNSNVDGWSTTITRNVDYRSISSVSGYYYYSIKDLRVRIRLDEYSDGSGWGTSPDNVWVYSSYLVNPYYKPTMTPNSISLSTNTSTTFSVNATPPNVVGDYSSSNYSDGTNTIAYRGTTYYYYDVMYADGTWHSISGSGWSTTASRTLNYADVPRDVQYIYVRVRCASDNSGSDTSGSWTTAVNYISNLYYIPPAPSNLSISAYTETTATVSFKWETSLVATAVAFWWGTINEPESSAKYSITSRSTTSYTIPSLTAGERYYVYARSVNANGESSSWAYAGSVMPHLNPSNVTWTRNGITITASCSGSPTGGSFYWDKSINGGSWYGSDVYTYPYIQDASSLSMGGTVQFRVAFKSSYNNEYGDWYYTSVYTRPSRPSNFSWTTQPNSSGGTVNITAVDWNSMIDKINLFIDYQLKNRTDYPMTYVKGVSNGYTSNQSDSITASLFNQLRVAINTLSTSRSLVSGGQLMKSTDFTNLANDLNATS